MNDNNVFDTTILVYALDNSEGRKHDICKDLVQHIFSGESRGTISNQIAAELFNVITTKERFNISKEKAKLLVDDFLNSKNWDKINYTYETVSRAMYLSTKHNVEFWDSLIAETAIENSITTIVTENEKDFKKIPGIRVINPFR